MQLHDTGLRFGIITLVLHWVSATLIGGILYFGLTAARMADGPERLQQLRLHSAFGALIFVLACYRLHARMHTYHPLPLGTQSPIEVIIGRLVAVGLLVAACIIPVVGWIAMTTSGITVMLFELMQLPAPFGRNPAIAETTIVLHWVGAYAFMAGLLLHVFGAFKHHFILKNDTLKRILGKHVEL
jgi:superoxide oxidase